MKTSTRVFLVLLRLAIGWHLLVEGIVKLDSMYTGPTMRNVPWSSKPYLLESTGPFADWFRAIPGDPDTEALELLRVPSKIEPQLPSKLHAFWDDYFNQWCSYYALTQEQLPKAREVFNKHVQETAKWFREGTKEVVKPFPAGSVVKMTTPERVGEYESKLNEYRILNRGLTLFNHDVWKERLKAVKGDVARLRNDLLSDIESKTTLFRRELTKLLTPEQRSKDTFVLPPEPNRLLWLTDMTTAWGLTVVGALLLLGLFTRCACLGGIGLLLLFYLAMPPLPWLPENPKAEGHYLLINKTLIEVIALGCLATVQSGKWAGLDGLISLVFRSKKPEKDLPLER